jgi:betaine-aldehyde dehydrogenase
MELGGKSPLIIFPDSALHNAVSAAMLANFYSNGEVCSNGTRVFVHESIYDAFVEEFVRRTKLLKVGPAMDPDTQISALIHRKYGTFFLLLTFFPRM